MNDLVKYVEIFQLKDNLIFLEYFSYIIFICINLHFQSFTCLIIYFSIYKFVETVLFKYAIDACYTFFPTF